LDSNSIDHIITKGSVIFSESKTKLDSCKIYVINGEKTGQHYKFTIKNCDSIAILQKIELKKYSPVKPGYINFIEV